MSALPPIALIPRFQQRIWGMNNLEPWFENPTPQDRVGEVWFSSLENETELGLTLGELLEQHPDWFGNGRCEHLPLLVKFLFTSEKLSVQVHPDDDVAQEHHGCPGKTECWHILRAAADATVAHGFCREESLESVREAALNGTLESLLSWVPVRVGDSVFTPAGTVHAIGAGLALCEIQQHSDVTYRLYDYGRGRELHLEQGLRVSDLRPAEARSDGEVLAPGRELLIACPKFTLERLSGIETNFQPNNFYHLWIQLEGCAMWGPKKIEAGSVMLIPAGSQEELVKVEGAALLAYPSWRATDSLRTLQAAQPAATGFRVRA